MDEGFASLRLKISTRENTMINDISNLRRRVAHLTRKAYLISLAYLLIIATSVSTGVSNSSLRKEMRKKKFTVQGLGEGDYNFGGSALERGKQHGSALNHDEQQGSDLERDKQHQARQASMLLDKTGGSAKRI
jgi:hypothetical protein